MLIFLLKSLPSGLQCCIPPGHSLKSPPQSLYNKIMIDLVSYKSKTRMQASFSESIFMCMPTMCYACPGLPSPRPRTFSVRLCVEAGHGAQDHEAHPSFCRRGSCGLKSKETGGDREWSRNCVHSCTPPSYYPALLGVYLCARHWSFLEL